MPDAALQRGLGRRAGERRPGDRSCSAGAPGGGGRSGILANAAFVLANFGEDIGAMMALVDRALALTPSFSRGWFLGGVLRLWAGQHHLAIEHAETALRLSPRERTGTPLSLIGEAYFFKREFDEAASKLLLSVQENPGIRIRTAFSPRAMLIWDGSTKRARSLRGCAALRLAWCRAPHSCGALRTASCFCRASARRWANRDDHGLRSNSGCLRFEPVERQKWP